MGSDCAALPFWSVAPLRLPLEYRPREAERVRADLARSEGTRTKRLREATGYRLLDRC